MDVIDGSELDAQLRRGADLQLLRMCSHDEPGAIEGSLILPADIQPAQVLDRGRDTIVYGCGASCELAATTAARLSTEGFHHIRLYAGGLAAWRTAGRPVQH